MLSAGEIMCSNSLFLPGSADLGESSKYLFYSKIYIALEFDTFGCGA